MSTSTPIETTPGHYATLHAVPMPPKANAPSSESRLRIGDTVGEYRLVREIGRGAMAVVFEATGPGAKSVALKALHAEVEDDDEIMDRFEQEGRILQALRHENIARVFDVGTLPSGTLYLVIELLEGEDLGTMLETSGPLPIGTAARYVLEAARGVAEAHAQGIVHRDLKPANIFLAKDRRGGRVVKVLDFGVAKVLSGVESHTRAKDIIGSPHYIAPEQLRSAKAISPQSDVWALGVVLYRMLTDTLPFNGDSIAKLGMSILDHTPRPIRASRPDCPPALEAIVRRCVEKDPAARYATGSELADALEPFAVEELRPRNPDLPDLAFVEESSPEDETVLREEEGTQLMPAAHALQQKSALASLATTKRGTARARGQTRREGDRTRAPRGRGVWVATILGALLLIGVGGYFAVRGRWSSRAPKTVTLRVTAQPEGASFSFDYGAQITAPAELSVATDERTHVLTVWKDGYKPETRELTVRSDTTLDVTLLPETR